MERKKHFKKRVFEGVILCCAMMGAIWFVSAFCGLAFKVLGI